MHSWKPQAPNADAPARDAYALRLVTGHTLYQSGRVVTDSPSLQRIVRTTTLRINPSDAGRLGVAAGDEVKVTSARASQTIPVEPDPGVPVGVCRLDFTADGAGPALLIDATAPVTDLRVESLR
jgi:anaerobic selenocysteine-containing dehydrogenase